MSKAVEKAYEAYPLTEDNRLNHERNAKRVGFKQGYEQAEKDICEWLEENAVNFVGLADNEHPAIGDTKAFYGTKSLIYYLKQAMKDE